MSALHVAVEQLRCNQEQWEAFTTTGNCVVLAPPGSGKTQLLTTKLADELMCGSIRAPRGAACITMTNEAAHDLRRRLRALGVAPRANLFIGTVHSFALSQVVSPFAAAAGETVLAGSRFATQQEWREALDAALDTLAFRPDERANAEATLARARARLDLSGDVLLGGPRIAELGHALERELAERRLYDQTGLVTAAVQLLEGHDWVPRVLGATYARIYVDEYQDLAPGLDRLVRSVTLRSGARSTLFTVGDPDQSLYGFSGAHPELLNRLSQEDSVSTVRLLRNYRSGQSLIDVAIRALGEKRQVAGQRSGGSVGIHSVRGGPSAQAGRACHLVRSALHEGTPPEEIAVLAYSNADRDASIAALREVGVPVFARIDEHWRSTALTMFVEAAAAWCARGRDAVELTGLLERLSPHLRGPDRHHRVRSAVTALHRTAPDDLAAALLAALLDAAFPTPQCAPRPGDDAVQLRRMTEALTDGAAAGTTVGELASRARAPGHVLASTIHSAKGLEFDRVIIVGADNSVFPGFSPSPDQVAERRRLFYVSLTRAREHVDIVHTDFRVSRAGRRYPVHPSPFLLGLLDSTSSSGLD